MYVACIYNLKISVHHQQELKSTPQHILLHSMSVGQNFPHIETLCYFYSILCWDALQELQFATGHKVLGHFLLYTSICLQQNKISLVYCYYCNVGYIINRRKTHSDTPLSFSVALFTIRVLPSGEMKYLTVSSAGSWSFTLHFI